MVQPIIAGIHHLKFPVADFERSVAFYERVLGARRLLALDHRKPDGELFAVILEVPQLGTHLELRLNPEAAQAQKGFDPVTLAVQTLEDLHAWETHLTAHNVPHSPVLTGMKGWVLALEDPDGRHVRFYTLETHGPELAVSSNPQWLGR
jgi:catechol 2,3-dioxygenase-like lactoylglutathione lyase family enzyme